MIWGNLDDFYESTFTKAISNSNLLTFLEKMIGISPNKGSLGIIQYEANSRTHVYIHKSDRKTYFPSHSRLTNLSEARWDTVVHDYLQPGCLP